MSELEVPQASLDALLQFDSDGGGPGFVRVEDVRAIATPVVVAELRRLLHDASRPGTLAEAVRDRLLALEAGAS